MNGDHSCSRVFATLNIGDRDGVSGIGMRAHADASRVGVGVPEETIRRGAPAAAGGEGRAATIAEFNR